MILFYAWLKKIFQKKKESLLEKVLRYSEIVLNSLLSKSVRDKRYDQLQILENFLRKYLLKTLDSKTKTATALMKKDSDMNKEMLRKLQEQSVEEQNPRFGNN